MNNRTYESKLAALQKAIEDQPTESLISRYQNDTMSGIFMANPMEVIKVGEPLSNSDEISKALEKGEFYKRRYSEFVVDLENFLNQYNLTIDSISGCYKPLSLNIRIEERSDKE